jgi:phage N-6-adenine-methyltransferase
MYLVARTINGVKYYSLEESYLENGKVQKRIVATLGRASPMETKTKNGKARKGKPTALARLKDKTLGLSLEQIHTFTCDILEREPNKDCWQTPDTEEFPILTLVRRVFGGVIDLDPTTIKSNPTGATQFFTMRDDCLKQTWHGNVFMNPPFSDPTPFLEKVLSAYQGGEIESAIVLLLAASSTNKGAGQLLRQADAWCQWGSRINYIDARSGMLIKGINQGSSLHYFGRDREQFSSVFLSVEGNKVYFH